MPYIITTGYHAERAPDDPPDATLWVEESRRAVATLDEAREIVRDAIDTIGKPNGHTYEWDAPLPESGGTIGPLPDGTVIVVERVTLDELAERTSRIAPGHHSARMQSGQYKLASILVDAYNAAQGS